MFSDKLQVELQLTIDGKSFTIPGANVKNWDMDLYSYGFNATISFYVMSDHEPDLLFPEFRTSERINVRFSVGGIPEEEGQAFEPIVINGIVTEKSLSEVSYDRLSVSPVLQRLYTVEVHDVASILWNQHYPTALYTDIGLSGVLKKHLAQGLSLSLEWNKLKMERASVCLGLGEADASFYDFVMWYVDENGGVFYYDYAKNKYVIANKKDSGKAAKIRGDQITNISVGFPETKRYEMEIHNTYTGDATTSTATQKQNVTGIHRDILMRTPIKKDVDAVKRVSEKRLRSPKYNLKLDFNRFQTVPLSPGSSIKLHKELVNQNLLGISKTYRIIEVHLTARNEKQEADSGRDLEEAIYEIELTVSMEQESDPYPILPEFRSPQYPIIVEGKIISELGKEGDRTYMFHHDKDSSQDFYKVDIPMWNKQVYVPFEPQYVPGHFYIPLIKSTRVLLALYFDHCEILRLLSWGDGVRVPAEGQGNHLLFGKNSISETSIKHVYQDNSSALTIRRVNGTDLQVISIEEGEISFETKEDKSLKKASETFDLSGKVAVAQDQLSAAVKGAIGNLGGDFEKSAAEMDGAMELALAETRTVLEGASEEISAKVDEVLSGVDSALGELGQKADSLKSSANATIAEMKKKISL